MEPPPVAPPTVPDHDRHFVEGQRVGRFATAGRDGMPHVVPVCFALLGDTLYVTIDEKPKRRTGAPLKRLRNIAENPAAAHLFDRSDEAGTRLGGVMLRGRAESLSEGAEHDAAQALLRARYPQLARMRIGDQPVIALRVARSASWGDLSGD